MSFDEITFPREPNVGFVIIKIIGFVVVIMIKFDPHVVEVGIWQLEPFTLDFS
jgi:hypothetical protein